MSEQPLVREGRVWLFPQENINTDLIMPQTVFNLPIEEQIKAVFAANRPGWTAMVRPGDIIVGGKNFGTGSSRPGAQLFKRLGIAALVAESINGLFYRNCINYALLAIECPGIVQAVTEGDQLRISFGTGMVENLTNNRRLACAPMAEFLSSIVLAGGVMQRLKKEGYI